MISRRTWIAASLTSLIGLGSLAAHAQMITAIAAGTPPNQSATRAFCLSAVYKGLATANPSGTPWQTTTNVQRNFLALYAPAARDLAATQKNVDAIATSDTTALANFFAHHGFPEMYIPITGGKAVGAVFTVDVTWPVPGESASVMSTADGGVFRQYRAAQMTQGVSVYQVTGSQVPLFKLATRQPGWSVYLMEAESFPTHIANLPAGANGLLAKPRFVHPYFQRLVFPVVNWQGDMDISFLKGMSTAGFSIDQAIGKAKIYLDEKRGHASSAAAMVSRGGPDPDVYEIKRPFYVIFQKDGTSFPSFVALAGPDSWQRAQR